MRRMDSTIRKLPKHEIDFSDPSRMSEVLKRIAENEEIVNAGIRQAQRKATEQQMTNQEVISSAKTVLGSYNN